ncbi:MAG: glycoside hydrolase family 28 protein [Terracidiphilus sp.]
MKLAILREAALSIGCLALLPAGIIAFAAAPSPLDAASTAAAVDVRSFGAIGDGTTVNTHAISEAIRSASKAGGGTVKFPPGVYVTGTIELLSNVTLDIQRGAILKGSTNVADYRAISDFGFGREYGVNYTGEGFKVGMIVAQNAQNIAIGGGGVIDGSGEAFFDFNKPHYSMDFDPKYTRQGKAFMDATLRTADGPVDMKPDGRSGTMIVFSHTSNILFRDITLKDAPNWTVHLADTQRAVFTGVHIVNNPLFPNNDGVDCIGCKDVHFSDCDIVTGDDDFAIVNSEDVTITNCSLTSRSSAIRVENTKYSVFTNLTIHTNRGIGIYERGKGKTSNLLFSDILIDTQLYTGHWWGKGEPIYVAITAPDADGNIGEVHDVKFVNISGEADSGIVLYGSAGAKIRDLTFDNVQFRIRVKNQQSSAAVGGNFDLRWTAPSLTTALFQHDIPGFYARYVDGLAIHGLDISWSGKLPGYYSSAIECEDFERLQIDEFTGSESNDSVKDQAAITLRRGNQVSIRNSTAAPGTQIFLRTASISGEKLFAGNDLSLAKRAFAGDALHFLLSGNLLPSSSAEAAHHPSRH